MNKITFFALILILCIGCKNSSKSDTAMEVWLTDPVKNILFAKQSLGNITATGTVPAIEVNEKETFQTIDGYGHALTGGSAFHLYNMDAATRAALLKELFATDGNNIGISYLRVSIGASDLDDHVFSYDDLPVGQTDTAMEKFSIAEDKKWLIPVLKEILAINPDIKILGSPWSPPAWMKTNDSTKGGSLKPEYYNAYAKYFVKYIQSLKAEGINIDAITIQNEPLHPGNNPSLLMLAEQQAAFLKKSLGPAFRAAGITTKIILYDHNADRPDYPMSILADKEAAQYVDGSAFHLYAGSIDTLSKVHEAFPDKNLYFTEQWVGAPGNLPEDLKWNVKNLLIGGARNWCKNYLQWNLAANSKWEPHTPGGCTECLGAVTIDGNQVKRNPGYYNIAHASKFVRPGSVRIASTMPEGLPNVAFKSPDGKKILVVLNEAPALKSFKVLDDGKSFSIALNAGAVATLVW
ncbi:glucosylceramidase [Chitinophagaceae bacterium LB-8]|jgi:glucosylceramidase|uniref:Glucosylceramidase n=1 Tax=Paraflavisolibacter caeni TaxID=2982496 RepID=A0A9X3BGU3_9BACT|nr:glycoside hydrolase family 30 beta sandwich domain-containing protein [Paraflavisolibacter caeni]MCU7551499.1 glucosylceramidase [Paraflavisolibacter caeni]